MRTRMPEDLFSLWVIKWKKLKLAALFEWPLKIPECLLRCALIKTCNNGALEQALANISRDLARAGFPGFT